MAFATDTFPQQRHNLNDAGARGGMAGRAAVRRGFGLVAVRRMFARIFAGIFARIALVALIGTLAGCSDSMSETDVQFVIGAMPPQFQSMRMYLTAPENAAPFGSSAHAAVKLQQGCEAVLTVPGGQKREAVILESQSAATFDLDAVRTADGWNVTSDGLAPPGDHPVEFRTQFTSCVSAIEDKYRSEPDPAPFSGATVFK
jgi:disulfide bond formation protein DsbB